MTTTQDQILDNVLEAHPSDAQIVESVIRSEIAIYGHANTNRVRTYIQKHHPEVRPQCVGAVYSGLVRSGVIELVGEVPSEDLRGRNRNKGAAIYRLVPVDAVLDAEAATR